MLSVHAATPYTRLAYTFTHRERACKTRRREKKTWQHRRLCCFSFLVSVLNAPCFLSFLADSLPNCPSLCRCKLFTKIGERVCRNTPVRLRLAFAVSRPSDDNVRHAKSFDTFYVVIFTRGFEAQFLQVVPGCSPISVCSLYRKKIRTPDVDLG